MSTTETVTVSEAALRFPPGSLQATELGCTCRVLDNAHGLGAYSDGKRYGWWINETCQLHGRREKP